MDGLAYTVGYQPLDSNRGSSERQPNELSWLHLSAIIKAQNQMLVISQNLTPLRLQYRIPIDTGGLKTWSTFIELITKPRLNDHHYMRVYESNDEVW